MRVAVVGGGIAGLTAATALVEAGHTVTVLEASERFGGQIRTERRDGFVIEHGAEGFIARSTAVAEICRRAGLATDLIAQATRRSLALRDGRLVELRDGEAAALLGFEVAAEDRGQGLKTLRGGMGDLIDALVAGLSGRARLLRGAHMTTFRPEGGAWRLEHAGSVDIIAEAVVLAVPAREAAALLAPLTGDALPGLRVPSGSTVAVTLAFPSRAVTHPLDASGLVVEGGGREGLQACTFSSSKFPGRAPAGWCLVRAFFTPEPPAMEDTDDAWCARARRVLAPVLGIAGSPGARWVSRWPTPRSRGGEGHAEAVRDLREHCRRQGIIECAGSAFDRAGIDGAVRSGLVAARCLDGAGGETSDA
jgi:oxygen-dependent protoporphyrinogen oxidase